MRPLCLLFIFAALVPLAQGQTTVPATSLRQAEDLFHSGHLDQAMQKLDALAADQPEPDGVEYLRGMVFYQQDKMAEAAAAFAKSVTQDPRNFDAMQMEGVSLFRAGKSAEA